MDRLVLNLNDPKSLKKAKKINNRDVIGVWFPTENNCEMPQEIKDLSISYSVCCTKDIMKAFIYTFFMTEESSPKGLTNWVNSKERSALTRKFKKQLHINIISMYKTMYE